MIKAPYEGTALKVISCDSGQANYITSLSLNFLIFERQITSFLSDALYYWEDQVKDWLILCKVKSAR